MSAQAIDTPVSTSKTEECIVILAPFGQDASLLADAIT